MIRTLWSHLMQRWASVPGRPNGRSTKRRRPARSCGSAAPSFEELEPRAVLTATMMPHYFFQAAVALHLDGAALFISQQYTTFTTTNGVTTTVLGPSPSQVQADIDLNTPYAQPFSALLVLAGEIAEINLINSFNNNPEIQALDAKVNNSL